MGDHGPSQVNRLKHGVWQQASQGRRRQDTSRLWKPASLVEGWVAAEPIPTFQAFYKESESSYELRFSWQGRPRQLCCLLF